MHKHWNVLDVENIPVTFIVSYPHETPALVWFAFSIYPSYLGYKKRKNLSIIIFESMSS